MLSDPEANVSYKLLHPGSLEQGAVDRGKIRRVLGSWTGQELDLK
jgi:hypothetical protein